jgi:hypothetical protein
MRKPKFSNAIPLADRTSDPALKERRSVSKIAGNGRHGCMRCVAVASFSLWRDQVQALRCDLGFAVRVSRRVMVLSAVGISRRMMVSETPAS